MKASKLIKYAIKIHSKTPFFSHIIVLILRYIFSFDAYVDERTVIEENVVFKHNGLGCVLHPAVKIKSGCWIYQNVTIGASTRYVDERLDNTGAPTIGENTVIYSGAVIAGPITIGKNCVIGANCVVTKDIPENSIVTNNSFKISGRKENIEYITPKNFKVKNG